jgi:hypothetical protein
VADDRDEERKRRQEEIRQGLETALRPTKEVASGPPPPDLAGPFDPAMGTGRAGREPARSAPSAEEDVDAGDERDVAMDEREEHDERTSQRDAERANEETRRT